MRRTKEVIIPGVRSEELGNRDNGKRFLLTEMPADQAERWATRLYLAMSRSGLDLPDGMTDWGAILAYGALRGLGSIQWQDAEPLLSEMWGCVQIVETAVTRPPTADDIEEVSTRYRLRSEVIELHTGFSPAAMLSALAAEVMKGRNSSSTPTSPDPSEQ
jgi:hypothetical protein